MTKSIARFDPVSTHPVEESERHYVEVHARWARQRLRQLPAVLSYHTNLVMRQYDMRGDWRQRPTAWRFVVLRFEGERLGFTPVDSALVARDHLNCLRDLRSCVVDERVLLDQRRGQTTFEKYLFEYDRSPDVTPGEADMALDVLVDCVVPAARDAFGLRLLVLNRVLAESEALPSREPGQVPTERLLPETTKHAYLEWYFDHQEWGDDFFAAHNVRRALQDAPFAIANGYHVHEACGLDRR